MTATIRDTEPSFTSVDMVHDGETNELHVGDRVRAITSDGYRYGTIAYIGTVNDGHMRAVVGVATNNATEDEDIEEYDPDSLTRADAIAAIPAVRTSPSGYSLNVRALTVGMEFTANGQTMRVVGEPFCVGYCQYEARVREVGGQHDGNEFSAHLYTR